MNTNTNTHGIVSLSQRASGTGWMFTCECGAMSARDSHDEIVREVAIHRGK